MKLNEIKKQCDQGELRAFVMNGGIYLEDTVSRETVRLDSRQAAGSSRVERMFGKRESWAGGGKRSKAAKKKERKPDNGADEGQGPYRGFLMVECEECGEVKCFCANTPTYGSRCSCGHVTALEKLRYAHMECKCGKRSVYRTNGKGGMITGTCVECKAPVDLELDKGKTAYVTIR